MKEAEANEQHKSIISVFKAAAPKWEFEHFNFVVGKCGSIVESDLYTKLKKLDVHEGKKTNSLPIMRNRYAKRTLRLLFPSSSRCKEVRGQPQRDRGRTSDTMRSCEALRWREERTLIERQHWGPLNNNGLRNVNWESQSKTPPQSPEDRHIYCVLLIRIVFCNMSKNMPLHCLFYVTMDIYFCFVY